MAGFDNPYEAPRKKAPGEIAQEYATIFKMVSFFFGVVFTDREKEAIPIVVGAIMREGTKFDLGKLLAFLTKHVGK